MIDYTNLDQITIEFEKRRIYGDPRDFELFEEKEEEGKNCIVSRFAPYTYPDLINDPQNKLKLSVDSIKEAFREFIRCKVGRAPEATVYERISSKKHTFHSIENSALVSLKSYQELLNGRKREYFGFEDPYKENETLGKILQLSEEKRVIIQKMNDGKVSQAKAITKVTPLQSQITELEGCFIEEHIENNIGKIKVTIQDNEIPQIPIKLHVIPPDDKRPFGAIVTSGMSAYPMQAPSMAEPTDAELFMLFSPEWPLPLKSEVNKDEFSWAINKLIRMVKYIHGKRQWFSLGHTFANGDPPKPFAKNTELCAFLFKFPYKVLPPTFCELIIGNKPVYFLQVFPIYEEEMDFIMSNSPEQFALLFKDSGLTEFTSISRKNLCKEKVFEKMAKGKFCKKCGTVIRNYGIKKKIKCPHCGEMVSLE